MADSETLPHPEGSAHPSEGQVIRGPWAERPPAPPDSGHADQVRLLELERQRARRERREDTPAARLYQSMAVLIGGPDALERLNDVLGMLEVVGDDHQALQAVIRQRHAGHRLR